MLEIHKRDTPWSRTLKNVLQGRLNNPAIDFISKRDLYYMVRRENEGRATSYKRFHGRLKTIMESEGLTYEDLKIIPLPKGQIFFDGEAHEPNAENAERAQEGALAFLFVEKSGVARALGDAFRNRGVVVVSTEGVPSVYHKQLAAKARAGGYPTFILSDFDTGGYLVYGAFEPGTQRIPLDKLLSTGGDLSDRAYSVDYASWGDVMKAVPETEKSLLRRIAEKKGKTGGLGKLEIDAINDEWGSKKFSGAVLKVMSDSIEKLPLAFKQTLHPPKVDASFSALRSAIDDYYAKEFQASVSTVAQGVKLENYNADETMKKLQDLMAQKPSSEIAGILSWAADQIRNLNKKTGD